MFAQKRIETTSVIANVIANIQRSEKTFGIDIISHPLSSESDMAMDKSLVSNACIDLDNEISDTEDDGQLQYGQQSQSESLIEIKKEEVHPQKRIGFSASEDVQLCNGINKYKRGKWAEILLEGSEVFHPCRTRDALRMRSQTQAFKRKYKC